MKEIDAGREIIEETGMLFENLGTTRMAGRILGYLMVNESTRISFDDLVRGLKASKSSISTNLKVLQQMNYLRAVSLPYDRKTYYTLNNNVSWTEHIRARSGAIGLFTRLFEKALQMRGNKADSSAEWLRMAMRFYHFSERMVPVIMDAWEKELSQDHPGTASVNRESISIPTINNPADETHS